MKILTFLLISSTVALGAQQLLPPGAVANIQQLNLNQPEWYKKDIVITARPPSQIQPSADSQVKSMRFSEDIYKNLTAVDFNTIFQNFPNLEAVDFWGCEGKYRKATYR